MRGESVRTQPGLWHAAHDSNRGSDGPSARGRSLDTMSVRRVMGTEVEYGVSLPGQPSANAMLLSAQVVNAYASTLPAGRARRAAWDFEEESPLRDARGFELGGGAGVAQEFVEAEDDAGMANVILPNGARLYVDHAHPEYSTPEVTDAARHRPLGQGRRADHGRGIAARRVNARCGHADQPVQEQHR